MCSNFKGRRALKRSAPKIAWIVLLVMAAHPACQRQANSTKRADDFQATIRQEIRSPASPAVVHARRAAKPLNQQLL
jgi:hypothetical protein